MATINLTPSQGYSWSANGSGVSANPLIVCDGYGNNNQGYRAYVRFTSVNVAQGATVDSASITINVTDTGTSSTSFIIRAENSDDATAPSSQIDLAGRARTTAQATQVGAIGSNGAKTYDITAVVQEVVNRAGWVSGNSINIFFDDAYPSTRYDYSDVAFDGPNGTTPPALAVDYVSETPVTVDATPATASAALVMPPFYGFSEDAAPITPAPLTASASLPAPSSAASVKDTIQNEDDYAFPVSGSVIQWPYIGGSTEQYVLVGLTTYTQPSTHSVKSANITFRNPSTGSVYGTTNPGFRIQALAVDNATMPASRAALDATAKTTAYVDVLPPFSGTSFTTADLSAVMNEVVSRAGFASGNNIAFVMSPLSTTSYRYQSTDYTLEYIAGAVSLTEVNATPATASAAVVDPSIATSDGVSITASAYTIDAALVMPAVDTISHITMQPNAVTAQAAFPEPTWIYVGQSDAQVIAEVAYGTSAFRMPNLSGGSGLAYAANPLTANASVKHADVSFITNPAIEAAVMQATAGNIRLPVEENDSWLNALGNVYFGGELGYLSIPSYTSNLWRFNEPAGSVKALKGGSSENAGDYINVLLEQDSVVARSSSTSAYFNGTSAYMRTNEAYNPIQKVVSGTSYTTTDTDPTWAYAIVFKTTQANAPLLNGKDNYLRLSNGYLQRGDGRGVITYGTNDVANKLNDGKWHLVTISRSRGTGVPTLEDLAGYREKERYAGTTLPYYQTAVMVDAKKLQVGKIWGTPYVSLPKNGGEFRVSEVGRIGNDYLEGYVDELVVVNGFLGEQQHIQFLHALQDTEPVRVQGAMRADARVVSATGKGNAKWATIAYSTKFRYFQSLWDSYVVTEFHPTQLHNPLKDNDPYKIWWSGLATGGNKTGPDGHNPDMLGDEYKVSGRVNVQWELSEFDEQTLTLRPRLLTDLSPAFWERNKLLTFQDFPWWEFDRRWGRSGTMKYINSILEVNHRYGVALVITDPMMIALMGLASKVDLQPRLGAPVRGSGPDDLVAKAMMQADGIEKAGYESSKQRFIDQHYLNKLRIAEELEGYTDIADTHPVEPRVWWESPSSPMGYAVLHYEQDSLEPNDELFINGGIEHMMDKTGFTAYNNRYPNLVVMEDVVGIPIVKGQASLRGSSSPIVDKVLGMAIEQGTIINGRATGARIYVSPNDVNWNKQVAWANDKPGTGGSTMFNDMTYHMDTRRNEEGQVEFTSINEHGVAKTVMAYTVDQRSKYVKGYYMGSLVRGIKWIAGTPDPIPEGEVRYRASRIAADAGVPEPTVQATLNNVVSVDTMEARVETLAPVGFESPNVTVSEFPMRAQARATNPGKRISADPMVALAGMPNEDVLAEDEGVVLTIYRINPTLQVWRH